MLPEHRSTIGQVIHELDIASQRAFLATLVLWKTLAALLMGAYAAMTEWRAGSAMWDFFPLRIPSPASASDHRNSFPKISSLRRSSRGSRIVVSGLG